ncbi:hypothetical protein T4E_11628 [Trichinella pseudospiralis]|uniref:Uncharacterized protein n=1 Tax=Trichinella pseudospiralis TaxID=6337 RepID=A0A0V0XZN9_TRIPS|nr:hypothetical protein T4E_11628 [Trichinella pseudospiralis]
MEQRRSQKTGLYNLPFNAADGIVSLALNILPGVADFPVFNLFGRRLSKHSGVVIRMSLLPSFRQASDDRLKGSFAQDIDMVSEHQPNVSRWQVSQMNPISNSPIIQVRLSRQWIYTATASISAQQILFSRKQRVICIVNSVL